MNIIANILGKKKTCHLCGNLCNEYDYIKGLGCRRCVNLTDDLTIL